MEQQVAVQIVDDLLQPFLRAPDEPEADRLLARLLHEQADPIITAIIKRKLRVSLSTAQGDHQNQDALEIAGDVRATLLAELRGLKSGARPRPITDFRNYVATKTYSACADYFRTRNPQRWRLRDLLRQQLKQNHSFALWQAADTRWLCGLATWRNAEPPVPDAPRLQQLLDEPRAYLQHATPAAVDVQTYSAADLLALVFACAGQPIAFNHLVTIAAGVWGIKDQPQPSYDHDDSIGASLTDPAATITTTLEQRLYLQRLWQEVCTLPVLQRTALLLNLRDAQGGSPIAFIPHLGIATQAEIASMLSITAAQFAQLWDELPLDDARSAQLLALTRQQVINLRKTARERLTRRMKAWETSAGSNK